jgi:hypothetical protein
MIGIGIGMGYPDPAASSMAKGEELSRFLL